MMRIKGVPFIEELPIKELPVPQATVTEDATIVLPIGNPERIWVRVYADELMTKELSGIIGELVHDGKNLTVRLDVAKVENSVWVLVLTDKHKILTEVENDG
jgi:hypothetical protein